MVSKVKAIFNHIANNLAENSRTRSMLNVNVKLYKMTHKFKLDSFLEFRAEQKRNPYSFVMSVRMSQIPPGITDDPTEGRVEPSAGAAPPRRDLCHAFDAKPPPSAGYTDAVISCRSKKRIADPLLTHKHKRPGPAAPANA
ncbi:hypothetical protein EVAR_80922_1 [Eumeta japonica]|uniref:Uncharacterized protein n=1 Tax=Eumeta variegata TaxID=151549 RepID=A0A4C1V0A8_EUMVA|nr:hypothetical protein EVAR_80922_1 [Eumeta japonica]